MVADVLKKEEEPEGDDHEEEERLDRRGWCQGEASGGLLR